MLPTKITIAAILLLLGIDAFLIRSNTHTVTLDGLKFDAQQYKEFLYQNNTELQVQGIIEKMNVGVISINDIANKDWSSQGIKVPRRDTSYASPSPQNLTLVMRLKSDLLSSLEKLAIQTTDAILSNKAEDCARIIYESMSISSRNYHGVQHVFDLLHDLEHPAAILAALFHDTVYLHVDGRLTSEQENILSGSVIPADGSNTFQVHPKAHQDRLLSMVVSIFGFEPGQIVKPHTGLNEFLSAVLAVRKLEGLVPKYVLAQIAACIEATIPFRPSNNDDTPASRLFQRLVETNESYGLEMKQEDIITTVQIAVTVSNEDVANFSFLDQSHFLDNTWSLIPEFNPSLRKPEEFTVNDLMLEVFNMRKFFSFVKADVIYKQFRGVPCNEEYTRKQFQAARNLMVGRKYVNAKLLSLSVLSAVTTLTGGDMSMFELAGDVRRREEAFADLFQTLPVVEELGKDCDEDVYNLLVNGRKSETNFDVRRSPLAAYFYSQLGDAGVESILDDEAVFPMDAKKATRLLKKLPREHLEYVKHHLAHFLVARKGLVDRLLSNI